MAGALYDQIGVGYARYRQPDPSIAAAVNAALGDARTVVNVGAGSGSYEPRYARTVAVEPSITMIRQRRPDAPPAVQAKAEALPFPDRSFDAAMAALTVHHWRDLDQGLHELKRVSRTRIVILTSDPSFPGFWLADYLPQLKRTDTADLPTIETFQAVLGDVQVRPVPIRHDCRDGFLRAYWRRPAAYLDSDVRSAISAFQVIGDVDAGLERLGRDLESGAWRKRYGALLELDELDLGYQLIIAGS